MENIPRSFNKLFHRIKALIGILRDNLFANRTANTSYNSLTITGKDR